MSDQTSESPAGKPLNLFDYTEDDLLNTNPPVLTHYEILNCPVYATQHEVKKAYRKASLKYHPDKTGRGEDDYVFLAVKAAHDTLMDHAKRQAYDSTVMPFDDSIPPSREKLMQDPLLLYKDDDFYQLFGPVFQRNLRFDARLRPDLVKGSNTKKVNQKQHHHTPPPSIGDANTPIEQVHQFYEYWVRFDSWRDFSSQAADELQIETELENAESRYEKRWIQKEIDKRAKTLKRQEMQRIQSLVERAMEADPRLRRERQIQQQQKEKAAAERIAAQQRQKEEEERNLQLEAELLEIEKTKRQEEKLLREKEKKLIRKERQSLRKSVSQSFESCNFKYGKWADSYEMSQDMDYLCNTLDLDSLKEFNKDITALQSESSTNIDTQILDLIHTRIEREQQTQKENEENAKKQQQSNVGDDSKGKTTTRNSNPWTKDELSALAKAVKKYPPGGGSRWEQISLFVNNLCKQQIPRSKDECIDKYNQIARDASLVANAPLNPTTSTANGGSTGGTPTVSETASKTGTSTNGGTTSDVTATLAATSADDSITAEDAWTSEQDQQLQEALAKYPASMDKNERWTNIAKSVTGKTKKQCVNRFKAIREALQKKK